MALSRPLLDIVRRLITVEIYASESRLILLNELAAYVGIVAIGAMRLVTALFAQPLLLAALVYQDAGLY